MTERGLGSALNTLCGPTTRKYRARIGQHPQPGRLFRQAKQTKEEIAAGPAELARTSSYSLSFLVRRPQVRGAGEGAKRNSRSQHYFCKLRT